ncbi:hypothetical protein ACWT_5052 [Actinoplanes sp. SE50]|uniref:hypothetical protein n=1 Tax=unclassified Actinoplanes TaxID=2626549 RepID=UPI00023ECF01|nr:MULTISPECIES: hypothetical protein [unclassified Actinoplanes]AEV86069.1 hypothetical protein ACPL_5182 [Actinoplanes sp. SE50/110]ATO84467.1 hypothetical protein ACWT_5052 [Actinoplanes sp. SE50]SLM01877.1 hypothetical protein ACSP50_5115 [Actinoplanes sp. SE50/110]
MTSTLRTVAVICGLTGLALAIWALFGGPSLFPGLFLILLAGGLSALSRGR